MSQQVEHSPTCCVVAYVCSGALWVERGTIGAARGTTGGMSALGAARDTRGGKWHYVRVHYGRHVCTRGDTWLHGRHVCVHYGRHMCVHYGRYVCTRSSTYALCAARGTMGGTCAPMGGTWYYGRHVCTMGGTWYYGQHVVLWAARAHLWYLFFCFVEQMCLNFVIR